MKPGDVVQSGYRTPWRGVILDYAMPHGCVKVRITHDRNGRPIRKPLSARHVRTLNKFWLLPWPRPNG
jgi:hypothetical protein